jgi:predicted DsbA family dithiol-disulfide isomerase
MGKRKFEKALAQFPQKSKVEVEWHSFELDPTLKTETNTSIYDYLARRKNITRENSVKLHRQLADRASEAGLSYDFDKTIVANSFDAHRLIQLAKLNGLAEAAEERLFKAYYTEGKDISDHLTLIILGDEIGLNAKLVKQMLDSDAFSDEVRYDEKHAQDLGIQGVPFFVINDRYGVSGAQQPEVFLETLEKAWQEYADENPGSKENIAEGATCSTEEGC